MDEFNNGGKTRRAAAAQRAWILKRVIPLSVILVLVIGGGLFLAKRYLTYSTYTVAWQKELSQGSLVGYEPFGSGFLKYSRDGVTCISARGNEQWIDTYEMKNPQIAVSGNFAVIADRQGSELRIYDADGKVGGTQTLLPLTRAAIAQNGVTAVIEEDSSSSYIMFFKKDGTALDITIKSIISGDGYPTDLAISPDGTRLMVSYEYLSGGDMKGRVVFYDFSEIGKNIPNRLVGGFDEPFADGFVADVLYFDGTWSAAVSTEGLFFFSSRNLTSPALVREVRESEEIRSLFYNEHYIGVVVNAVNSEKRYRLEVYKPDGTEVFKKEFDEPFTNAAVDGDHVFLFSQAAAQIYNMAGVRKFSGELDFPVVGMRMGSLPGEYLFAGTGNLKAVRLH